MCSFNLIKKKNAILSFRVKQLVIVPCHACSDQSNASESVKVEILKKSLIEVCFNSEYVYWCAKLLMIATMKSRAFSFPMFDSILASSSVG